MKSAIIPFRKNKNQSIEILLVQNISGKKWIVPKGNIKKSVCPAISSAIEAYEEAGVLGKIIPFSIGSYLKNKVQIPVYMLAVDTELKEYKEQKFRRRKWATLAETEQMVDNSDLFFLIKKAVEVTKNKASYFKVLLQAFALNEQVDLIETNKNNVCFEYKVENNKKRKVCIKRKESHLIISIKSNIKHVLKDDLLKKIVEERLDSELQKSKIGKWSLNNNYTKSKLKLKHKVYMYDLNIQTLNETLTQLILRIKQFETIWQKHLV